MILPVNKNMSTLNTRVNNIKELLLLTLGSTYIRRIMEHTVQCPSGKLLPTVSGWHRSTWWAWFFSCPW